MDLLKTLAKIFSIITFSALIMSCANPNAVPGAYPTSNQTPILAGVAATNGAIAVGTTAGMAATPIGAAIGGAAGGAMGYFADSPNALLAKLAQQGVQVVAIGQSLKLIISSDNCFTFGTSTITNQCDYILNNTAALLKLYGNTPIKVTAYSDNNFGEAFAQRITQEQADSTVAYLWAHGIPQQRFTAKGYGSANNIATNYTVRGNGLNRRVEISLG